jgi:hypothetical protein
MTDWAGWATLIAAIAAALLSGASLFLSGRREDLRWKREVLVETMVSFFDASFDSIDTTAFKARQDGEELEWHRERYLNAHAVELQALTRLRFLAKPKVLQRVFELHDIEDGIYSAVFNVGTPLDASHWADLVERRRVARTNLFNASRRNLGLRRTLPVWPALGTGPSHQEIINHKRRHQESNSSLLGQSNDSSERKRRTK